MNPRRIVRHKSTHYSLYTDRQLAVNERMETVRLSSSNQPPTAELLRINHYWSKSEEDYRSKISRGWPDLWGQENPYDMSTFVEAEATNNELEETTILRFLPQLKARLARRHAPF